MNNKIRLLIFLLIVLSGLSIFSNSVSAERCLNRNLLGRGDVFWGNPPPVSIYQVSPRQYNNVTATFSDLIRFSIEGEFPEKIPGPPDCTGWNVNFEIYFDGSTVPIRSITGNLSSGIKIIPGNLGSWQWYLDWPHNLSDGVYRFKLVRLNGDSISSYVSSNTLTVVGAGPPPPSPTVTIDCQGFLTSCSIPYGSSAIVAWSSRDAASCTVLPSGWTGTSGSENTGSLTSSQTYVVDCSGPGGVVSSSIQVIVNPPPPPTATIDCNGLSSSCSIAYASSATINWSSSNATSCTVSPSGWTGLLGSKSTGSLISSTTYTLSCSSSAGTTSASVLVSVAPPPPPPPTASIDCDGTSSSCSIAYASSATINWSSSNATSCTVSPSGWTGLSGSRITGSLTVTTAYTVRCSSSVGIASDSVTVSVAPPPPPPPTASITCNGLSVACSVVLGSSVALDWICTNSSSGTVTNSLDSVTLSGLANSVVINPPGSVTYFLSCVGPGGKADANVVISVFSSPSPSPLPGPGPAADFFGVKIDNPFSGKIGTIKDLFNLIITFLYYVVGPIIVMMIIAAGLLFLFSRGDSNKVTTAKKILLWALVGLAIVLIGGGFISLLESIFALGNP